MSRSSPGLAWTGVVLVVLLVMTSPLPAQQWRGAADLALVVTDEAGNPLEGAVVILRPESELPGAVPPPFFTDTSGVMRAEGLAEGDWEIEVRSAGYMIVMAYEKLVAGAPPIVGFTTRQRTGTFLAPLQLRFLDSSNPARSPVAATAGLDKSERRQLRKAGEEARRSERRAEKNARAAEKRRQRSTAGAEVATLEPQVAAATKADTPPPEPPAPVPAPAPAPQADPAPARPVPPIESWPVLFHGGACPECKTGEWALVIERTAAVSSGLQEDCGSDRAENLRQVIERVIVPAQQQLDSFAGPLADSYGNSIAGPLGAPVDDAAFAALDRESSPCQHLVGILPLSARFVGFRFEARDSSGGGDCFGTEECSVGRARWMSNPEIERTETMILIHSSFLNESTETDRRGRLTILFEPAAGWAP